MNDITPTQKQERRDATISAIAYNERLVRKRIVKRYLKFEIDKDHDIIHVLTKDGWSIAAIGLGNAVDGGYAKYTTINAIIRMYTYYDERKL